MTVANVSLFLGQSNAISYSTNGVAYPGGWTAASLGGGYAEAAWTGTGWAQYVPGSTSYGSANYWGPEGALSLRRRAQSPQCCTYIYKYAVGGVGIEQGWNPYYGSTFSLFLADLSAALGQLTSAGLTPSLKEMFWIGNESDCFNWPNASAVAHDLPALISAIRAAYPASHIDAVIARTKLTLGSGPTSPCPWQLPYVDIVRAGQMATAAALSDCAWINCDAYASGSVSPGHYDPPAVPTMGTDLHTAVEAI